MKKKTPSQPPLTLDLPFPEEPDLNPMRVFSGDTLFDANWLRLPFSFIDSKKAGKMEIIELLVSTQKGKGKWVVSPSALYGAAGPFHDAIYMALFKELSELPKPVANPIPVSITKLCKIMEVSDSMTPKIKEGLKVIASLTCTSEFAYFNKANNRYLNGQEGLLHLISKLSFAGDVLDDGTVAETNLIWLDESILNNVNRGYVCPIDSRLYFALNKPIAKALLKMFMELFYATHGQTYVSPRYSTICKRWQLKQEVRRSHAEKQLGPGLRELIEHHIIESFSFEEIAGVRKDWAVKVKKGKVLLKYFTSLQKSHEVIQISHPTDNVPLDDYSGSTKESDEITTLIQKLIDLGVTKKKAGDIVTARVGELTKIRDCIKKFLILRKTRHVSAGYLVTLITNSTHEEIKEFLRKCDDKEGILEEHRQIEEMRQYLADAIELYHDEVDKMVSDVICGMSKDGAQSLEDEARRSVPTYGIPAADAANVSREVARICAQQVGFPSKVAWLRKYFASKGKDFEHYKRLLDPISLSPVQHTSE